MFYFVFHKFLIIIKNYFLISHRFYEQNAFAFPACHCILKLSTKEGLNEDNVLLEIRWKERDIEYEGWQGRDEEIIVVIHFLEKSSSVLKILF